MNKMLIMFLANKMGVDENFIAKKMDEFRHIFVDMDVKFDVKLDGGKFCINAKVQTDNPVKQIMLDRAKTWARELELKFPKIFKLVSFRLITTSGESYLLLTG